MIRSDSTATVPASDPWGRVHRSVLNIGLNHTALRIYVLLATYAETADPVCLSLVTMSEQLGRMNRTQLCRGLRDLEDNKLIRRIRNGPGTNRYFVLLLHDETEPEKEQEPHRTSQT